MHDQGVQDSLEGKAKDVKGRVKDAAGGLTGDTSMQAEGKWDRLKGNAQDKLGQAERDLDSDTD
ncbi:MAG TPA: CsbD family protein [Longimicrobiaceae bacterium]|nr:CsbD family protein [Longimicrobiaceae bacterium]